MSTTASTAEAPRVALPSLTGMRFVAAFMVFCGHAMAENLFGDDSVNRALVNPALAGSFTGVSFFFVLSGFVLTWSARDDDTKRRFWRRRFWRIYPVHLVTWLSSAVIGLALGNVVAELMNLPSLFLLHALFPRPFSINEPSWSLSVEAFFYLLFPLLLRWVKRIRPERLWLWAGLIVAAIAVVGLVVSFALPSQPWQDPLRMTWVQQWLVYSLPPVRTLEFVLGIVMARIVLTGRWIRLPLGPAVVLLVAGYLGKAFTVTVPYGVVAPTIIPIALVIPAAAAADLTGASSVFRTPAMLWLGRISYAFFMVHFLVLHFGHQLLLDEATYSIPVAIGVLALAFVVTVGVSALLHHYVEQPAMLRWSQPRRRREGTTAGA